MKKCKVEKILRPGKVLIQNLKNNVLRIISEFLSKEIQSAHIMRIFLHAQAEADKGGGKKSEGFDGVLAHEGVIQVSALC